MVSLEFRGFISPEVEDHIATKPYHVDGVRQLAAMLPEANEELEEALLEAARRGRGDHLEYGLLAAAFADRKLSVAVVRPSLTLQICGWTLAKHLWRMEGDVLAELRWAFDSLDIPRRNRPILLFTAGAIARRSADSTPMPQWIITRATALLTEETARVNAGEVALDGMDLMSGLGLLFQDKSEWEKSPKADRKLRGGLGWLEAPFEKLLFEKRTRDWNSVAPQRRAVRKIGANEQCPCGSGKKYKKCCKHADDERLSDSSAVAGMTMDEFEADPTSVLTDITLSELKPHQLLRVKAADLLGNLQGKFFAMLMRHRQFDVAIGSLRECAVLEGEKKTLPGYLHPVWQEMLNTAVEAWDPRFARHLLDVFPDAAEKLGEARIARGHLLAVGDDLAKFLEVLEAELHRALNADGGQRVQEIIETVLSSPWRALGIFLARSLLPIAPDEIASELFEKILVTRARIDLSPDDKFSEFMEERALKKARRDDSIATAEQEEKLERVSAENRAIKEQLAQLKRTLTLTTQQQRRQEAQEPLAPDPKLREEIRELQSRIKGTEAFAAEKAKETRSVRRELERATREVEALRGAQEALNHSKEEEENAVEVKFEGNQPVRSIDFPKAFPETLAKLPSHAGRAVMRRIGLLAAGDKAGFHKIKQLTECGDVLRLRFGDYRLLFRLLPNRVQVLDLIDRKDLTWWIKQSRGSGV